MNKYQAVVSNIFLPPTYKYTPFVSERLVKTNNPRLYASMGLVSEMGELCDLIAKGLRNNEAPDFDKWCDEAGDCLFYLTALRIQEIDPPHVIYEMLNFIYQALEDEIYSPKTPVWGVEPDLETININKLLNRELTTGSHLK